MKRSLQLNPDHRPADWQTIKRWRDTHKAAPVETSFGPLDADNESAVWMSDSIEQFAMLPTVSNGRLNWKMADNSYRPFTKAELIQALAELRTNRAVRGAMLQAQAEAFRAQTTAPTPAQLSSLAFWLGE